MNAKDLNGKTVASNGLTNVATLTERYWMDRNGSDSSTVHFIEMPLPQMADAVRSGKIDGASFDAVSPRWLSALFFSTSDWVGKHPAEAQKFALAMREAAAWANTQHSETAQILSKYTKFTPEQIQGVQCAIYLDAPSTSTAP